MAETIKKLIVKKYRVPIERSHLGKVSEKMVELTDEMLMGEEEIEIPKNKTIMFFLPEFSKKVKQFNERQLLYAKENSKDYIEKKIITR